jgi:hypothetical protein
MTQSNIFGKDIGVLKGKTPRQQPHPVVSDHIEIPHELIRAQKNATLCIDSMKVNGMNVLTTISQHVQYRTAQFVPKQTPECYQDALQQIFKFYDQAGLTITTVHCDNEFRLLMDPLEQQFRVA